MYKLICQLFDVILAQKGTWLSCNFNLWLLFNINVASGLQTTHTPWDMLMPDVAGASAVKTSSHGNPQASIALTIVMMMMMMMMTTMMMTMMMMIINNNRIFYYHSDHDDGDEDYYYYYYYIIVMMVVRFAVVVIKVVKLNTRSTTNSEHRANCLWWRLVTRSCVAICGKRSKRMIPVSAASQFIPLMSCNRKALFMFLIVVEFFCPKLLHHKKIVQVLLLIGSPCPGDAGGFCQSILPQRVLFLQLKSLLLVTRCWSVCSTGQGLCHCSARPIQNPPDWEFRVSKEKLGAS